MGVNIVGVLKKAGKVLQVVGQVVGIGSPIIQGIVTATPSKKDDQVYDTIMKVYGILMQVESMNEALGGALTSEQKLIAATPVATQVFTQLSSEMGLKIRDPQAFKVAVQQVVSGCVGVLNACHEDGIETVSILK